MSFATIAYGTNTTTASSNTVWINLPTSGTATTALTTTNTMPIYLARTVAGLGSDINIDDGKPHRIKFLDGTIIDVKADGSFEIKDDQAKVVYRANRIREFNPFLNASDKLEAFIKFCGDAGVRQGDVLAIPIKHFIAWLVVESARADNEPEPDMLLLPDLRRQAKPHCASCGRFISPRLKARKIEFCAAACFDRGLAMARAA